MDHLLCCVAICISLAYVGQNLRGDGGGTSGSEWVVAIAKSGCWLNTKTRRDNFIMLSWFYMLHCESYFWAQHSFSSKWFCADRFMKIIPHGCNFKSVQKITEEVVQIWDAFGTTTRIKVLSTLHTVLNWVTRSLLAQCFLSQRMQSMCFPGRLLVCRLDISFSTLT